MNVWLTFAPMVAGNPLTRNRLEGPGRHLHRGRRLGRQPVDAPAPWPTRPGPGRHQRDPPAKVWLPASAAVERVVGRQADAGLQVRAGEVDRPVEARVRVAERVEGGHRQVERRAGRRRRRGDHLRCVAAAAVTWTVPVPVRAPKWATMSWLPAVRRRDGELVRPVGGRGERVRQRQHGLRVGAGELDVPGEARDQVPGRVEGRHRRPPTAFPAVTVGGGRHPEPGRPGAASSGRVTVPELKFATARSGSPSPLKSAAATHVGPVADDVAWSACRTSPARSR